MMSLGAIQQSKLKLKAISFVSSSTQYVTMGNHPEFDFEKTNAFSVSCWFKSTATGLTYLVSKSDTATHLGSADLGWALQIGQFNPSFGAAGCPTFLLTDGYADGSHWIAVVSSVAYNDGAWHHVVGTSDGTGTKAGLNLWVDGAKPTQAQDGFTLSGTIKNSAALQLSGRAAYPSGEQFLLDGSISDVAIYSKELSSSEVATVYASHCPPRLEAVGPIVNLVGFWRPSLSDMSPTITDLSASGHNGTLTNGPTIYSR